jgi:hypothetical protein
MIQNVKHLSNTISNNMKRYNRIIHSSYLLDAFYKNHLIDKNIHDEFKDELLSHQQYNEYNYKKHIIYTDNILETLLIEWKTNSFSPVHDHNSKGCIMMLLQGDIKERLFHPNTHIFQYERNLTKGISRYIDNYNHLHSIYNMSKTSSYTLHIYPKE